MFRKVLSSFWLFFLTLLVNSTSPTISQLPASTTPPYPIAVGQSTAVQIHNRYEAIIVGVFTAQADIPVSFEVVKPALDLAIEEVRRRYPHLLFRLVPKKSNTTCLYNHAAALASEEYYLRKVSAFVGPACSLALDSVGRMASYWNVPVFTAGGVGYEFSRKNIYTTLTRLAFSLGK